MNNILRYLRKCVRAGAYGILSSFRPRKVGEKKMLLVDLEAKFAAIKADFKIVNVPDSGHTVPIVLGAENVIVMYACMPNFDADLPQDESSTIDESALAEVQNRATVARQLMHQAVEIGNKMAKNAANETLTAEVISQMAAESPYPRISRKIAARARRNKRVMESPEGQMTIGAIRDCPSEFPTSKAFELKGFIVIGDPETNFITGSCELVLPGCEEFGIVAKNQVRIRFDPSTPYGRLILFAKPTGKSLHLDVGVCEKLINGKEVLFLKKIHNPLELVEEAVSRLEKIRNDFDSLPKGGPPVEDTPLHDRAA